MVWTLETMSSAVLLYVILIQGVYGTIFPPASNPPPIPSQIRTLDNSPQAFYIQEDLTQSLPQPVVKEEELFSIDPKLDDQRWYFQENQSADTGEVQSSIETFDRHFQSGEPAIGPVATPIPDETYIPQQSSVSKLNPSDLGNVGGADIWILTRRPESQYIPERWVQLQVPAERFIEVINQNPGTPVATDTVKSVVGSVPPEVQAKTQFSTNPPSNIVQQIWVRAPNTLETQKAYTNPSAIVEDVPSVKQIVDIPPANIKQVVPQQIISDASPVPFPLPAPAQITSKKSFTVPPPPPPPLLKGIDASSKLVPSVPVNVIPDSNFLVSNKNVISDSNVLVSGKNVMQQVRHIWVPTSARTGKFITIPVSSPANSGEIVVNKGLPLDSTPAAVSDTWVLKQNGPIPTFQQQKSVLPPVIQSEKVIFQDSAVVQMDGLPNTPIIAQVDSPKYPLISGKNVGVNAPIDIWPVRKDIASSKVLGKSPDTLIPEFPVPPSKSDAVVIGKSFPLPSVATQKTILTNSKSPLPPQAVQVVNGKPCPIPLPASQKSLYLPRNPIAVPRVVGTQRGLPFPHIIRVNRYPSGNYYLLNRSTRPTYFSYPNPALVQQSKTGLVRLVQTRQIPVQLQGKQPILPLQTKQIAIPVQSKQQVVSPVSAKQIAFPFPTRQIVVPSPKSTRIIYPTVQAIRYAYPWSSYSKSGPVPGKGVYVPQFSPLRMSPTRTNSDSSSSESSSSESSSESSQEDKEGKPKKEEKLKENTRNEENSNSDEKERETESETKSEKPEKDTNENTSEMESEESMETSESQISLTQTNTDFSNTDGLTTFGKPYLFRFDNRDKNSTVQHREEVSDADGRVTGTYGYQDPEGYFRLAKYVADTEGFRVNVQSNEPGTVTHESAHVNFISDQGTKIDNKTRTEQEGSSNGSIITNIFRD